MLYRLKFVCMGQLKLLQFIYLGISKGHAVLLSEAGMTQIKVCIQDLQFHSIMTSSYSLSHLTLAETVCYKRHFNDKNYNSQN